MLSDIGTSNVGKFSAKQIFLCILPVLLVITTYCVFQFACAEMGLKLGYLIGFVFYWVVWCLLIPLLLLGRTNSLFLFRKPETKRLGWLNTALLVIPCLFAIFGGPFFARLPMVTLEIALLSFALALVNAFCEEVLWRGVYFHFFDRPLLGFGLPLIGFALWHVAPNSVHPASVGVPLFLLFCGFLGAFWGIVAYRTKSIRWTILSHVIVDFSGFGALFYLSSVN